ncbi:TIGR01244 family sulfur transferase [Marinicellulosiphila megalodicopiae]|uniref:TIGR01244 family sulfur transferase n=1 Tax=Marinicellulosiphila megalodicopiae TaxID=2724896 RepID=UPI003BAE8D67
MNLTYIADHYAVSPQILPSDITELKDSDFVAVVCNRPDGEDEGQPTAKQIEDEAAKAGLAFIHLPMTGPMMTHEQLDELEGFLEKNQGKVFSYCRSGNRSSIMYQALQQKIASQQ